MPFLNTSNFIKEVFTINSGESGERYQVYIVKILEIYQDAVNHNLEHVKFRCSVGNDMYEEIVAYNELL